MKNTNHINSDRLEKLARIFDYRTKVKFFLMQLKNINWQNEKELAKLKEK